MEWIKQGFDHVLMQMDILNIFTWEEIERKVCGSKEVSVNQLRAIAKFVRTFKLRIVGWEAQQKFQVDVVGSDGRNLKRRQSLIP